MIYNIVVLVENLGKKNKFYPIKFILGLRNNKMLLNYLFILLLND